MSRDYTPETLLPGLSELIEMLVEPALATEGDLSVEEMTVDLPVELQLTEDAGRLGLFGSAPTQQIATSVLPVWHRVRLRIGVQNDG